MKLKKKMKKIKFHLIKKNKSKKKKQLIIQMDYYVIKRIKKMKRNLITKETKKKQI